MGDIHICPVIVGEGGKANKKLGILQIVVGAILIAASFGSLAATGLTLAEAGFATQFFFNLGVGFVVGGAMALLFPPPVPSFTSSAHSKSYLFSSLENSTVQGAPIPIGYGRLKIGSKVIETSLSPKNLGNYNKSSESSYLRNLRSADMYVGLKQIIAMRRIREV